jgi:hypothetical protein
VEVVAIVVVVLLAIGAGIWGHQQAKKRRLAMQAFAAENGLTFSEGRDHSMESRFPVFKRLREGSNRYAYNVMAGARANHSVCCFDYHYETYSTNSKGQRQTHHHHYSAVVLEHGLPMRALFLRPEGFFDKVTEMFGWDDIDFESGQFSREFFVKAPDKRWAFDVLHQGTIEFLLESPRYHVEFQGPFAMAWRGGRFQPADFAGALRVVEGILGRLPKYVLQDIQGAGS